jgi:PAB1-binding protein PBP1
VAESVGVVYELFVSPGMAVPPVGNVYHRYCPLVPPVTESVIAPDPQKLPLTGEEGAVGMGLIVAVTRVRALSHVPLLIAA